MSFHSAICAHDCGGEVRAQGPRHADEVRVFGVVLDGDHLALLQFVPRTRVEHPFGQDVKDVAELPNCPCSSF